MSPTPERLQQVLWNLLSNAVKFTDVGTIKVAVRREGSKVTLTVTDTGSGIAPEFMPFVFDRFRQADASITRRMGGLGLGLALVRHSSSFTVDGCPSRATDRARALRSR